MSKPLRFDGKVALVTGAGNGLGRQYALDLAERGASVVVNDLGGDTAGKGASESPAATVVAEIVAKGGKALASYDSVATRASGQAIVDRAIAEFGRIDIVINNAGILRNAPFDELDDDQIDSVLDTHLKGLFYVSQPAFRLMKAQGYGRFVFTSSGTGMFGNGWQANYGAAKAATTGLMQIVAIEGKKHGILANAVLPGAVTRLNDDVDPDLIAEASKLGDTLMHRMTPEFVSPVVIYLASEECSVNQTLYSAVGGRFALIFPGVTQGWTGPLDRPATPEEVARNIETIEDRSHYIRSRGTLDDMTQIKAAYEAELKKHGR